jgi:hypoxanthine phosphoribosyltransferase
VQDYKSFLKEILINEDELQKRVAELGAQISQDYAGKDLLLVCVLRGAIMFLTDLMSHLTIPHQVDFMAVTSYGIGQRSTTGQARINLDLNTNIRDLHVVMIEDIIDSGYTMASLVQLLTIRRPLSLAVCTLLDKAERREIDVPIKYCGFTIPDKFVFGYGLDMDEYYRDLPFIGVVDLDKFKQDTKGS